MLTELTHFTKTVMQRSFRSSDQDLANVVVNETAALIDEYWNGDVQVIGNLDLSLLGLAGIV